MRIFYQFFYCLIGADFLNSGRTHYLMKKMWYNCDEINMILKGRMLRHELKYWIKKINENLWYYCQEHKSTVLHHNWQQCHITFRILRLRVFRVFYLKSYLLLQTKVISQKFPSEQKFREALEFSLFLAWFNISSSLSCFGLQNGHFLNI